MEKIPENLVTEGLFFNKKWMSCSMLILINQLWQMVILLFKRDLEKLNSRWFKNSLRIVEANLKKKPKSRAEHLEVCFVCACGGISEDGESASFPGSHRDLSAQV